MVNAHSHAFQLDLRGWRAAPPRPTTSGAGAPRCPRSPAATPRLDARRRRARLRARWHAAGYGAVGEFHYVHHQPDGTPLRRAERDGDRARRGGGRAGAARSCCCPAAYHRGGWTAATSAVAGQRRFCDPDVETFLERVDALRAWAAGRPGVDVGVAVHSVRAVPASWIEAIGEYAERARPRPPRPRVRAAARARASAQAEHGCTPIELLERSGFLGPRTASCTASMSRARHRAARRSGTIVITCPTTEGNLGDGYLPALRYRDAGVRLAIGTDSQGPTCF